MGDRTGLTKLDRTNGYEDGRGYMRAKKNKLAQQNEQMREALRQRHNAMRTELFKGISINVNGRTQPTADELKRLILLNGGEYHPYYRYQHTKFMIATNLSTARTKTLRPDDRIVRPQWIIDSLEANCILPFQDYQLFAEEPRGKTGNLNLALDSDHSNQAHPSSSTSTSTSVRRTNSKSSTSSRTTSARNDNSKKQATMNDFVIRGVTRPSQQFPAPKVKKQQRFAANICGRSDIDSIIAMLNEWVGCPEGVLDEDVACVTKYFYDLMSEKNYHNKLCEVIKAFRQRVIQLGEKCWIELYNNLASTIKLELNSSAESSRNLNQLISLIEDISTDPTVKITPEPGTSTEPPISNSTVSQTNAQQLSSIPEVIDID